MTSAGDDATPALQAARRDVLERAGGTYGIGAAAELLAIAADEVRKQIRERTLVAYRSSSGELRLPRAQFTEDGDVLQGLEEVLGAMHIESPWMRMQLLLDDDVMGALREGRVADAVRAVDCYLPRAGAGGKGADRR